MSSPLPSSAQPLTSVSGGAGFVTPVWQRWFNSLLDGGTGALTPADIGVTVQAYSPNLDQWSVVIPSSFLTNAAAASTYLTIADAAAAYQPLSANLTSWSAVVPASFLTVATAAATYLTIANAASTYLTITNAAATYLTSAAAAAAYQPLNGNLSAWAAYNTNGLLTQTAAGTYTGRTLTGPASGISVTNGNGVAGNPTLALTDDLAALEALTGTNTIYYRSGTSTWTPVTIGASLGFTGGTLAVTDPELAAIAGLTSAADTVPYFTGLGTAALAAFTAFGRSLVAAANAAAARTALALGTAATQNTGTSGGNIPFLNGANTWANINTFAGGAPIAGITNGGNAAAGYIGEYIESSVADTSAVALTSGIPVNMTSIALTAGDWVVRLSASFNLAGTTSITSLLGSISLTSATVDLSNGRYVLYRVPVQVPGGAIRGLFAEVRLNVSSPTTVYAVMQAAFAISTAGAFGIISATRMR